MRDHSPDQIRTLEMSDIQFLHDFPIVEIPRGDKVVVYTFLQNVAEEEEDIISIQQNTLLEVFDWFSRALNRRPNGSEVYAVARQLYVSGRYAQAMAAIMLFRGELEGVRIHGGGADSLQCIHLQGHVSWKLGYKSQCLSCMQEVMRRRGETTLEKSVRLIPSSRSSNIGGGGSSSEPLEGPTSFEGSWQLLVEMGIEVEMGGERKDEVVVVGDESEKRMEKRRRDKEEEEDLEDGSKVWKEEK